MEKSDRLELRLKPAQHARLSHLADRLDMPMAEILRSFVDGVVAVDGVMLSRSLLQLRLAEPHYDQVSIEKQEMPEHVREALREDQAERVL